MVTTYSFFRIITQLLRYVTQKEHLLYIYTFASKIISITLQELRKYPTTQRPLPFQKICEWRIIGTIIRNQASIGGYFQRMSPIPIKCFPKSATPSDQEKFEKLCKEVKSKQDDQKSMSDRVLE